MPKNNQEMTIEDLAIITKKGFDEVDKRFEGVNNRFDKLEDRFDKLEATINRLPDKVYLGDRLAEMSKCLKKFKCSRTQNFQNKNYYPICG
ncbi:MAG: hypothetical protein ACP5IX_03115 [Patescibacteria group bacterium]